MKYSSNLRLYKSLCLLLAVVAFPVAANAAASTTFANFADDGNQGFVFTNSGSTSSFTSTSTGVNFFYDVANSYAPLVNGGTTAVIPATLLITGVVNGHASESNAGIIDQGFNSLTLTFTNAAGDNLLTIDDNQGASGTFPSYVGTDSSQGGGISSSTSSTYPQSVVYTSSYLNFSNNTEDNFGITFSSLVNSNGSAGPTVNANGYLNSFTASGTGTFAAMPSPAAVSTPEPDSLIVLALAAFGVASLAMLQSKRRLSSI